MAKMAATETMLVFNRKDGTTSFDGKAMLTLTLYPVRTEDGRVVNFSGYNPAAGGLRLTDLQIVERCFESEKGERRAPDYFNRPRYEDATVETAEQATAMARTLTTITRRLDGMKEQLGAPKTFGAYVARIATAIKATHVLFARDTRGWGHSDANYEWLKPGEAGARIDGIINDWANPDPFVTLTTDAPAEYDGFGTSTVAELANGYRTVKVARERLVWQETRYRSGNHSVTVAA